MAHPDDELNSRIIHSPANLYSYSDHRFGSHDSAALSSREIETPLGRGLCGGHVTVDESEDGGCCLFKGWNFWILTALPFCVLGVDCIGMIGVRGCFYGCFCAGRRGT